ncbi:MAG TPA: hypothetical protein VKW70_01925 [Terriglobia bacterium]|nr:hypothetical protein [Terriglobia bacterium]
MEAHSRNQDVSTQCFNCARIYYKARLTRCPRCKSHFIQHFSLGDLVALSRQEPRPYAGGSVAENQAIPYSHDGGEGERVEA